MFKYRNRFIHTKIKGIFESGPRYYKITIKIVLGNCMKNTNLRIIVKKNIHSRYKSSLRNESDTVKSSND